MQRLAGFLVFCLVCGLFWLVTRTAFPTIQTSLDGQQKRTDLLEVDPLILDRLNSRFAANWDDAGLNPAEPAPDLTVLRRLSLALHGSIPSLEEIRRFEADPRDQKLQHWCSEMLDDPRFADYFSERFARTFVGTQGEPFLVFRRDRFKTWLSESLRENRPYDEIVREIIAGTGLWTGEPACNFVTHAVNEGVVNHEKLAGRTVRAVLGQRMDCAECHDHPFADWKQDDFRGLAAFYGQVKLSPFGVEDDQSLRYEITPVGSEEPESIEPLVPFGEEWLPAEGAFRERLASWATSPENRRFGRATVNRVWGLMFGKAFSEGYPYYCPVDDLPDPELDDTDGATVLDVLAKDFVESGYDLRRLIRTIAASRSFRMASALPEQTDQIDDREYTAIVNRHIDHWAVFPLVRLRPEQVVGSILQASSVKTVDQNSALFTRTVRFIRELDFVREYGDFGPDELLERTGTMPQALLRMNGELVQESTAPNPFTATPRLSFASSSPEALLDNCYLISLTRRPSGAEKEYFLNAWAEAPDEENADRTQDMYWILINSPEFSWNH